MFSTAKPFLTAWNFICNPPTGEELILKKPGVRIINSYDDKRIKIHFTHTPDCETLRKLIQNGWCRSRYDGGSWQRKNTRSAIRNAQRLFETLSCVDKDNC